MLLEPYYTFRIEVPTEMMGRVMTDIQRMNGDMQDSETDGEMTIFTGSAPVAVPDFTNGMWIQRETKAPF